MRTKMRSMLPPELKNGFECCRYCTPEMGRSFDCHAKCEQYANARAIYNNVRGRYKEQRRNEGTVHAYTIGSVHKVRGRKEPIS